MPSGVIVHALTDIAWTRSRMRETQRDFVACIAVTREIIEESWLMLAEADRLLDRRDSL